MELATLSLSTRTHFFAQCPMTSPASAPAHMCMHMHMHMHMHMCMQHAHGHVHARHTGGLFFYGSGRHSGGEDREIHTHTLECGEISVRRHGTLRCEVQVSDIVSDILISFSYCTHRHIHTGPNRAPLDLHTPQIDIQLPTSSFPPILAVLTHGHACCSAHTSPGVHAPPTQHP